MKFILKMIGKNKLLVGMIAISTLAHSLFALGNGLYSKYVFDGIVEGNVRLINILIIGLLVTLWGALSLLLKNTAVDMLIGKVSFGIRNSFVNAVTKCSVKKIKQLDEGRILNNYTQDINSIAGVIKSGMDLIIIPFEMIISVAFLYYFNWKLATVVIVVFPFIMISGRWIGKKIQEISKKYLFQDDRNVKLISRIVKGIEVIKVHGYRRVILEEFEENTDKQLGLDMKRARYNGSYSGITDFFMGLPFVIVYVSAAFMLSEGNMTAGTLTLFLQLLNKITVPFVAYSRVVMQYKKAKVSVERLNEVMNAGQEDEAKVKGFDRVSLDNVTFGYSNNCNILKDCTFSFEPDVYYGVIGANGSGKSTVCKLLMGLYAPDSGKVKYTENGSKSNKVVYIEDKPAILFDDILKNIVGNLERDETKLDRILRETELKTDEFDNIKGKKAEELSAGLLQRMVIARALYQLDKNDLLVIDEGFSALDADMRSRMYRLIGKYQKELGLLIFDITHNLNECDRFDMILEVKDGCINPVT